MNCPKNKKVIFKDLKGQKKSIMVVFATFCRFSQFFILFSAYSFLGMILISCREMDLIELFKRLFSSLEMSGLAHLPIIIDIISSSKVLPKCIASCIFSGVIFFLNLG